MAAAPVSRDSKGKSLNTLKQKPKVDTLYIFDSSKGGTTNSAEAARARFSGRKGVVVVGVSSWSELTQVLGRYATVEELVLSVHGNAGDIWINNALEAPDEIRDRFAQSGIQVTNVVRFESCNVMQDPPAAITMLTSIVTADTKVIGATYYLINGATHAAAHIELAQANALVEKWQGYYWDGAVPVPERLVEAKKRTKLYLHWFADDWPPEPKEGEALPEYLNLPNYRHVKESELKPKALSSLKDLKDFAALFGAPVEPTGYLVTVTGVPAILKELKPKKPEEPKKRHR